RRALIDCYVDDLIIVADDQMISSIKTQLAAHVKITDKGNISKCLGMRIRRLDASWSIRGRTLWIYCMILVCSSARPSLHHCRPIAILCLMLMIVFCLMFSIFKLLLDVCYISAT